jgi:hypothetical protein
VNDFAAGALERTTLSVAAVTLIDHVCPNKSSGKLFYLAVCKKSQTLVQVTSTSPQFKACYVKATRVTRKVSNSTTCRATENTIPKVPANTTSLYFCVDSDGLMYFKGTTEPTCGTRKFAVEIGPHNQPPTAASQSVSADEDTAKTITLEADEPDGDAQRHGRGRRHEDDRVGNPTDQG